MSKTLSIRLPDQTAKGLEQVAATLGRPKACVVRKALDSYLADFADDQIALDRLRDKDDAILSRQEFKKKVERREINRKGRPESRPKI